MRIWTSWPGGVQAKGSQFVLAQYQKLKQPMAWASEKMFSKEKRALKLLKAKLGTHKRAKTKREIMSAELRKQRMGK